MKKITGRDLNREKIRARDNYTCQDCGKKWEEGQRRFDIHHLNGLCGKKSRGYDKMSEESILITLCHKCHFNRPEHKTKSKEKKWSDSQVKDMLNMCKNRFTYREIGERYGFSRQRAEQIIKKFSTGVVNKSLDTK